MGSAGVGRQEAAVKADICKHGREIEITEQFAGGKNGKKIKSSISICCAVKAIPVWDYHKCIQLCLGFAVRCL